MAVPWEGARTNPRSLVMEDFYRILHFPKTRGVGQEEVAGVLLSSYGVHLFAGRIPTIWGSRRSRPGLYPAQHLCGSFQSGDQVQSTRASSLSGCAHREEGKQSDMVVVMKATGLRKISVWKEWIGIQDCHTPSCSRGGCSSQWLPLPASPKLATPLHCWL